MYMGLYHSSWTVNNSPLNSWPVKTSAVSSDLIFTTTKKTTVRKCFFFFLWFPKEGIWDHSACLSIFTSNFLILLNFSPHLNQLKDRICFHKFCWKQKHWLCFVFFFNENSMNSKRKIKLMFLQRKSQTELFDTYKAWHRLASQTVWTYLPVI